jgi:nitrogen fixation protein FixH
MAHAFPAISTSRAGQKGRWIPWIFVGAMLGVVSVNAVLIFFAFASWGGTVTSRPYERGIDYNRVLAAAARESALGWTVDTDYQPAPDGRGTLTIVLLDAEGAPVAGQVNVAARRPLEAVAPVSLAPEYAGDGRYVAALTGLARPGVWDFRIEVARAGDTAHFTRRVVVR